MIDITGLPHEQVLMALYDGARVQGIGVFQATPGSLTEDEARGLLSETKYFDYLRGRVMKVQIEGDSLEEGLYDRDNGPGAAEAAINHIRPAAA